MKKIITVAAFLVLSTISAKAVDLGAFSVTAGLASNSSVWGASGSQQKTEDDGVLSTTSNASGVFVENYSSQFIELGVGQWIAVGYEHIPSISTPQNVSNEGKIDGSSRTLSVDFNDVDTTYLKFNTPFGIYFKYGHVDTDLDIKESGGTNKYKNVSTSGESMGMGYQKSVGSKGFGVRVEGNYLSFDDVSTNNGITTASVATGGPNAVKATNLEGLSGKVALTWTLGRRN